MFSRLLRPSRVVKLQHCRPVVQQHCNARRGHSTGGSNRVCLAIAARPSRVASLLTSLQQRRSAPAAARSSRGIGMEIFNTQFRHGSCQV